MELCRNGSEIEQNSVNAQRCTVIDKNTQTFLAEIFYPINTILFLTNRSLYLPHFPKLTPPALVARYATYRMTIHSRRKLK
jgi:hypothetical protein